jgi:signal transduction histidine kinase
MQSLKLPGFLIIAALYTLGFWVLEVYLQRTGTAQSVIASIAILHNAITTLFCSIVFYKLYASRNKWIWIASFLIVGAADLFHGFLKWGYKLKADNLLVLIADHLYIVFAILITIALFKSFKPLKSKGDKYIFVATAIIYFSIQYMLITQELYKFDLPIYSYLHDMSYDAICAIFISLLFIIGLKTKTLSGLIFVSSLMLIICSDFAIRFYDYTAAIPDLTIFNYGWELGFSIIGMLFLWISLNHSTLDNIFHILPRKSMRFEVGGVSLVALCTFVIIYSLANKISVFAASYISVLLLAFLMSWTVSNLAALWFSAELFKFKHLLVADISATKYLSMEVSEIIDVFIQRGRQLASTKDELCKQKNTAEKHYQYISHDIRSPLSVLQGYIAFKTKTDTNNEEKEYSESADRCIKRLTHMADDLFDCANASHLNRKQTSLFQLVCKDVLNEIINSSTTSIASITTDVAPDLMAHIDPQKISRVIINILYNSTHATPNTGSISLSAEITGGSSLEISIDDNGKGIPPDELPHIFESFYTRDKQKGTGLGLSYCKQAIEAHGGTIVARSEVGKGTTFIITIPNCITMPAQHLKFL